MEFRPEEIANVIRSQIRNYESKLEQKETGTIISYEDRFCFVRRYWYADSVSDIADRINGDSRRISVRLFRTRERLYRYLKEEGLLE